MNTTPTSEPNRSPSEVAQPAHSPVRSPGLPPKQGLYDPWFEHEACGVGFVVDMHGRKSHKMLTDSGDWREHIDLTTHRYMREDVEVGLAFLVSVGRWAGVPTPVASGLLGHFVSAVSGGSLYRKSSFLLDSLGTTVFSPVVSIHEDPMLPKGLASSAFDDEGVAKEQVVLLERGVCRELVYDTETATAAGRRSSGHGLPAPNPWGPFPLNQAMSPGEATREELLGGLDRGLYVTRIWYSNPVHEKRLIMTGMTRDGTYLVEDGRIVAPVRNLRFTQSYLDVLRDTVAVGRERKTLSAMLGTFVVPALRASAFTFTGVSRSDLPG